MGQNLLIENFTEKQIKQIKMLYGWGHTVQQIADYLGMGRSTFYEYLKRFPELKTAMRQGKAEANVAVDRALFAKATDGDVQAIRWWDMSRRGIGNYPSQAEDELGEDDEMNFETLSDDDLLQLKSLMDKAQGITIEGEFTEGYDDVVVEFPKEEASN